MKLTILALSSLTLSALSSQAALVHAGGNVVEITSTADIFPISNFSDGTFGDSSRFVSVEPDAAQNYFTAGGVAPQLRVDLGQLYQITSVSLWNYFSSGGFGNSVDEFTVAFSATTDFTGATVHTLTPTIFDSTTENVLPLGTTETGRYALVTLTSNSAPIGGIGNRIGMSEIQFEATAVPEPSSSVLLGLSGLALILRRRR